MRSSTPKALHEICGRPMILWPVQAARDAGAGRIVVVDSPARALDPVLPDYAELAVQAVPDGTGGAVAAALEHIDTADGAAPAGEAREGDAIVVLSGDVPLVSAALIRGLIAAHEQVRAAGTIVTARLADPSGYGRVVRGANGSVERVV